MPRFHQNHIDTSQQKITETFPIFVPKVLHNTSLVSDQSNTKVFNRTRSTRVRKRRTADFALENARELEMMLTDVNTEEKTPEPSTCSADQSETKVNSSPPPVHPKKAWEDKTETVSQKPVRRRERRNGSKQRPVSLVNGLIEKGGDAVNIPSPLVSESISNLQINEIDGSNTSKVENHSECTLATDINNILNPERLIRNTQSRQAFKTNNSRHSVCEDNELKMQYLNLPQRDLGPLNKTLGLLFLYYKCFVILFKSKSCFKTVINNGLKLTIYNK